MSNREALVAVELDCNGEDLVTAESESDDVPRTDRRRLAMAITAATALLVVFAVVSALIFGAVFFSGNGSAQSSSVPLRNSEEYQVSLFPEYWDSDTKRLAMAADFLEQTNKELGTNLTFESGLQSTRKQFYYNLKGSEHCGSSYTSRVREYISGDQVGLKYIDLKHSDASQRKACGAHLSPSPLSPFNLFESAASTLKCERDVHACKDKYGMEARMPIRNDIKEMVQLTSCNDLATLFPWAFTSMSDSQRFNPIEDGDERTFWWVWSFDGFVDKDGLVSKEDAVLRMGTDNEPSVVKSDFTLDYTSAQDAVSGENGPNKASEWSMKLYERTDGSFDPAVRDAIVRLHSSILELYGSRSEYEQGKCL